MQPDDDDVGQPVLPLDATRALSLADALVAWVPPQQVSGLVRALDRDRLVQQACAHLKRVHRAAKPPSGSGSGDGTALADGSVGGKAGLLAVMLCLGGTDLLSEEVNNILAGCGAQPQVMPVPKHPPLTRKQFDDWGKVWPLHFHEAAVMRSLGPWTDGAAAAEEHDAMRSHMRRAIALAEAHAARGGRGVAAVAVRDGVRIAECVDATLGGASAGTGAGGSASAGSLCHASAHPLGHAVLLCIEEVARLERAVAERMPRKRPATSVEAIAESAAAEVASATATVASAAGAASAAEKAEKATTTSSSSADAGAAGGSAATTAAGDDAAGAGAGAGGSAEDAGASASDAPAPAAAAAPHLCAGCDIYVTLEPCAMCAMALVHSRVRRLIYALPAPEGGALGSRYHLHAEKSLNHHFCVLRGALRREAEAATRLAGAGGGSAGGAGEDATNGA